MQSLSVFFFFFSSRRRHTRYIGDWSSDVCSSDLGFVPCCDYGTNAFQLNQRLVDLAFSVTRDVPLADSAAAQTARARSEERRVGKECRSRWARESERKK